MKKFFRRLGLIWRSPELVNKAAIDLQNERMLFRDIHTAIDNRLAEVDLRMANIQERLASIEDTLPHFLSAEQADELRLKVDGLEELWRKMDVWLGTQESKLEAQGHKVEHLVVVDQQDRRQVCLNLAMNTGIVESDVLRKARAFEDYIKG